MQFGQITKINSDDTDGAWYCHRCTRENAVIHYLGAHPFVQMRCGQCNHVACTDCYMTSILTPINPDILGPAPGNKYRIADIVPGHESYGSICPNCGITHRAQAVWTRAHFWNSKKPTHIQFQEDCECGMSEDERQWTYFHIGSNKKWRLQREQCYMEAVEHRIKK
ncbi:hypothetical protein M011DRAFT_465393 [Sporormia fimetaria CBS 119925]|uniref:Probable double zinc ribbon domain-containing protein n=1 Tax=Sporormia fimetaria CBS 119925 TaxID=1340428 RepID=A0A6A6VJJ7_9PLEO|nr:hypothetical protein M011DRAFT_465393 [Sporormia fimetaria CBS 119925]